MTPRTRLPQIPVGWNTLVNPQEPRYAKTYNYFDSAEASSSFQKSVRRGKIEAIQWALELYWTGPWYRTNIWNRILVTAVEDIGLACPEFIVYLYQLRKADDHKEWSIGNYISLARAVELSIKAQKNRANDWAAHAFNSHGQYDNIPLDNMVAGLISGLQEKNPDKCLYWSDLLWSSSQPIKSKYRKAGHLIWICLSNYLMGKSCDYFPHLYELAMSINWRWQGKDRLLYTHLILLHCYEETLDWEKNSVANLTQMPEGSFHNPKADTLMGYIAKIYFRTNLKGVPDYALDMHTLRGKKMGRRLDHFIEYGSILKNRAEELNLIEDYYLQLFMSGKSV